MVGFLGLRRAITSDVAVGFLTRWSPREAWTLVTQGTAKVPDVRSFLPPAGAREAKGWIEARQRKSQGLLFLAGRTETPMHTPIAEEHLTGSQHIALSLPGKPIDAAARLKDLPRSTALINTGRGVAAIWTLRAPVPLATAVALGGALGERCGGTLAWLVPLPGTRRMTGELVTVIHHAGSLLYTPAELGVQSGPAPIRVRRASEVEARPIDWMWRHMMAVGELTIIAGFGSAGKTTMCLSLAASVSRGQPWPDGTPTRRGSALIIEGEDDIETVTKPRLIAAGADLDRVHIVDQSREMLTPALLDRAAAGIGDLRLVVLSPLRRLIHDNQATNTEIRARLEPLIEWAKARRVGMIGVMHPQKGNGRQRADALAGSAAYTELARMVHLAAIDEDDPEPDEMLKARMLKVVKTNNAPPGIVYPYRIEGAWAGEIETSRVVWQADGVKARHAGTAARSEGLSRTASKDSDTAAPPHPSPARSAEAGQASPRAIPADGGNVVPLGTPAERWLANALADGPRAAAELKAIAPKAGVPVRSLQRGADRLRVERYREGGTQMWRLPATG